MGRQFDGLDETLRRWIEQQHLFFVATAPNDPESHVNLSPKGAMDSFRILGPTTVAYIDLVGSGIETVAHLQENGRIVLMFCAFAGPPKIVRLHGRGRVVPEESPEFEDLIGSFSPNDQFRALARSVIVVDLNRIADSCGFVVPRMDFVGDRDQLVRWVETNHDKQGDGWKESYIRANNAISIDGLSGIREDDRARS